MLRAKICCNVEWRSEDGAAKMAFDLGVAASHSLRNMRRILLTG
jgi:hypothetical protein